MEDIVIVESKDYAQVLFDDIHECYMENNDLICSFTLNELLNVDKNDFIGIFKVGFAKCNDYVVSQMVNLNEISNDNRGKIVFSGDKLPKDDGEFYQFVYVSNGKQIRGASIPFQFKRTHICDYVDVDEEQESVLIKSKETDINDTLNEIKLKCVNLSKANETYERILKENDESIKLFKDELTNVKMRCLRLTMENEKLTFNLQTKCDNLKSTNDTLATVNEENHKLKEKFEYLSNENRSLIELLQRRISQVESIKGDLDSIKANKGELEMILNAKENELQDLRKERDGLIHLHDGFNKVNDQILKLEKQLDERYVELSRLKDDLKHKESLLIEQTQTIQTILTERDSLNQHLENLYKEKADLEATRESLQQELVMSKDKLMADEQCKELMRAQLAVFSTELDTTKAKVKESNEEIEKLQEKEKLYIEERDELLEKMNRMKEEYEAKLDQSNGAYYALNLAHIHLANSMRSNQNKYEKEIDEQKRLIESVQCENENLKQRLRAGACEYATLNNKYLKLKNQMRMTKSMSCYNNMVQSKYDDYDSLLQDQTISDLRTPSSNKSCASTCTNEFDSTLVDDNLLASFYSSAQINKQNDKELNMNTNMSTPLKWNKYDDASFTTHINTSNINKLPTSINFEMHNNEISNKTNQNLFEKIEANNCEICGYIFPTDLDVFAYELHINSHYGPSCPVCFFTFRKGYPQEDFENHVNSHFAN